MTKRQDNGGRWQDVVGICSMVTGGTLLLISVYIFFKGFGMGSFIQGISFGTVYDPTPPAGIIRRYMQLGKLPVSAGSSGLSSS